MKDNYGKYLGVLNTGILLVLIVLLCSVYFKAKKSLVVVSENLYAIGNAYIEDTLVVTDTIMVDMNMDIAQQVNVGINLLLNDSVPVSLPVRYHDKINIPVSLDIADMLHIDTTIRIPKPLDLSIKGTIPINQRMHLANTKWLSAKVATNVPLQENVTATVNGNAAFRGDIPVNLHVTKNVPVDLDLKIPVSGKMNLRLPIATNAAISFPEPVPVNGKLPIRLVVPIKIPLAKTPLKTHLDKAAAALRDLF